MRPHQGQSPSRSAKAIAGIPSSHCHHSAQSLSPPSAAFEWHATLYCLLTRLTLNGHSGKMIRLKKKEVQKAEPVAGESPAQAGGTAGAETTATDDKVSILGIGGKKVGKAGAGKKRKTPGEIRRDPVPTLLVSSELSYPPRFTRHTERHRRARRRRCKKTVSSFCARLPV